MMTAFNRPRETVVLRVLDGGLSAEPELSTPRFDPLADTSPRIAVVSFRMFEDSAGRLPAAPYSGPLHWSGPSAAPRRHRDAGPQVARTFWTDFLPIIVLGLGALASGLASIASILSTLSR